MAVPAGIAAASTEVKNAIDQTSSTAVARGRSRTKYRIRSHFSSIPLNPIPRQHLPAEQKEEDRPLEHWGNGGGETDRELELVAADENGGEEEGDADDPERVESRQPGDDDRGVPVTGGEVPLELVRNSGHLAHP